MPNEFSAGGNELLGTASIFGGFMFEMLKPLHLIYLIALYVYHAILSFGDTDEGSAELDAIEQVLNVDLNGDGTVGGQAGDNSTASAATAKQPRVVRGRAARGATAPTSGG